MKGLKLVPGIAAMLAVTAFTGCSESQKDTVVGTYKEAVNVTSEHMEKMSDYWGNVIAKTDACDLSEQDWVDFAGGVAAGTTVTGVATGESSSCSDSWIDIVCHSTCRGYGCDHRGGHNSGYLRCPESLVCLVAL